MLLHMNGNFTMGKLKSSLFVIFGGRVFQQTVDIPMGKNCATLLADLFLYSYEADFIQGQFFNYIKARTSYILMR
jgi:hypothetical protein